MKDLKVALAQFEVKPAKPLENGMKMIEMIKDARDQGADMVVFSEMCIPSYLIGDIWERPDFLQECEDVGESIIKASQDIIVVFGNVAVDWTQTNEDGRPRKYNAMFVAKGGQICQLKDWDLKYGYGYVGKCLLPDYREFEDTRHFYSIDKLEGGAKKNIDVIEVPFDGEILKIGGILCEDAWDTDYSLSPCDIMYRKNKPDIFINISCSPYTFGKNNKRNRVFSDKARQYGIPMVYVNNVGIQNNNKTMYTFDGQSCVYDGTGKWVPALPAYAEGIEVVEVPVDKRFQEFGTDATENDFEDIFNVYHAIEYGCRKFLDQIGVKKVVIALSGGIDSAVSAAIFSDIVDPEDLYLINMPSENNSETTKSLAAELAANTRANYSVIPIQDDVTALSARLQHSGFDTSGLTYENIQARDRLRIAAAVAQSVGGVFVCNGNKSEMTVGYATLYGDIGGFLAPLADLWKNQVYEIARSIPHMQKVIPQGIIDLVPSAELSPDHNVDEDKGDPLVYAYHDKLFASWVERWNRATPFDILSWYKDGILEEQIGFGGKIDALFPTVKEFIDDLERWWNAYNGLAVAKRSQAPMILAVSCRAFGADLREAQTGPYYSTAYQELKGKLLNLQIEEDIA